VSDDPTTYLRNTFSRPFTNIKWKYTNTWDGKNYKVLDDNRILVGMMQ
jgi:hypothetical protein